MFLGIGWPFAHFEREIAPIEIVDLVGVTGEVGLTISVRDPDQTGLGKEEVARLVPHPMRNTTPAKRKPLRVWRPYFRSGLGLSSVFLFMC